MKTLIVILFQGAALLILLFPGVQGFSQPYPNPYKLVEDWAKLPDGRMMGAVGKVTVDPDGEHIWAVIRCDATEPDRFGDECLDSDLDPIVKFDQQGNVVQSFGGGMFIWPHGLDVDNEGNVWVTESVSEKRRPEGDPRGHQVIKFSPEGKVLMVLGKPGVAGNGNYEFNAPSDVAIAENGDIFIADGHSQDTNKVLARENLKAYMHLILIQEVGCLWRIEEITGFRSLTRKETSFRNGPSLENQADYVLMKTTTFMLQIRNQISYKIPVGKWEFALAMPAWDGYTISLNYRQLTLPVQRQTVLNLLPLISMATYTGVSRGHGNYKNM